MKSSFTRGFDTDEIIKRFKDAKVEGVGDFVNSLADVTDKLSQFFQKNISLSDNIDQSTASYVMFHNKILEVDIPNPKKKVKGVVPFQSSDFDAPVTSFSWRINLRGKLELKAWFLGAPAKGQTVSMSIFY